MEYAMPLNDCLKFTRKYLGLRIEDIAPKIFCGVSTLYKVEQGKNKTPSLIDHYRLWLLDALDRSDKDDDSVFKMSQMIDHSWVEWKRGLENVQR